MICSQSLIIYHYGITQPKENGFAIRDVFINAEPGYITCLLGKNAAGKTTLLSLLYGMQRPKSGYVNWEGKQVNDQHDDGDGYFQNLAEILMASGAMR